MQELLVGLGFLGIFLFLIVSIIGALILWLLAKSVGKISNAGFFNSWLVILTTSAVVSLVIKLIGLAIFSNGLTMAILTYGAILAAAYITFGKLIWKSTWMQSFKANLVWILMTVAAMAYIMIALSKIDNA
jgi:hypothetical protein